MTYQALKKKVHALQEGGSLSTRLCADERADWAYGNAVIENDRVTLRMAKDAVRLASSERDFT